jgi:hypothetical protein
MSLRLGLFNEHVFGVVLILATLAVMGYLMLACVCAAVTQRRWVALLVGLAVALPAGGLTGLAVRHGYEKRATLLAHGLHTQGVVLDKRSSHGRYTDYYLKYRFDVPAGSQSDERQVTAEDLVDYRVYAAATIGTLEPILYDPAHITHSMVETGERRPDAIKYIAVTAAVFFAGFMLPFVIAWQAIDKTAAGRNPTLEPRASRTPALRT